MNLSFNHLSDAQLTELSKGWLFDKEQRAAFERYTLLKALLPELEQAHDALLGLSSPAAREARYKDELSDADLIHDQRSRGVYGVLDAALTLTGDVELERLIKFLYPAGASINAKTYMEEAGEGARIKLNLNADHKKLLGAIRLQDNSTLLDHVNERIAQAVRMGDLLDARANEDATAPVVAREETRGATRLRWITVARVMLQSMGVAKVSEADARLITAKLRTIQR